MKRVLPVIVIAQFLCTSLWFAGNAVLPDLIARLQAPDSLLAHMTSAVQLGFISGTLLFALLTINDRYAPSNVFFFSAVIAAGFNLLITIEGLSSTSLLLFRMLTGFFLAGIYPVGMKIASDYFQQGLGKSLGFLVGALVLGTAFPHLLKSVTVSLPWKYVLYSTSGLALVGGMLLWLLVPDGPHRKPSSALQWNAFLSGFRSADFRAAAFGYFGHMWELYAFWAFVPLMLTAHNARFPQANLNVSLLSFFIIGLGGLACVISGLLSQMFTAKKVATTALLLSGICCLASPWVLQYEHVIVLILFLIFWGAVVIADSPLFSTMVAQSAPEATRGTSLTIVNSVGFAITIVSIQFLNLMNSSWGPYHHYLLLAIGPALGLFALLKK